MISNGELQRLVVLEGSVRPFQEVFNSGLGRLRFVALLSLT